MKLFLLLFLEATRSESRLIEIFRTELRNFSEELSSITSQKTHQAIIQQNSEDHRKGHNKYCKFRCCYCLKSHFTNGAKRQKLLKPKTSMNVVQENEDRNLEAQELSSTLLQPNMNTISKRQSVVDASTQTEIPSSSNQEQAGGICVPPPPPQEIQALKEKSNNEYDEYTAHFSVKIHLYELFLL